MFLNAMNALKLEPPRRKFWRRIFTINRVRIMSGTQKASGIIPDSVAQYSDERIGASRWRMSIEKAKRSLRCSFAWLRPGSGMALETHPGDFRTKSSARNSGLSRLSRSLQPLSPPRVSLVPCRFSCSAPSQAAYSFLSRIRTRASTRSKGIAKI